MTRKASVKLHSPPHSEHPLSIAPEWLGDIGRAKWAETIAENQHLVKQDSDFLAMYCAAWQEFMEASRLLETEAAYEVGTNGSKYPHPAIARKNKALDNVRRFGRELGIARQTRKEKPKLMPQGRIKPA